VLQQCLIGVGDRLTTMVVVLLSMFVVFLLSRHTSLGVYGTRWAIAIGTIVMAGSYAGYFRAGRWRGEGVGITGANVRQRGAPRTMAGQFALRIHSRPACSDS
jgi:Na+-driven multidrug efflux pump